MKLPWIIVLALLALVVYLIITRPPTHDYNKAAYLDTLRFLKSKESSIIAQEARIIKRSNDRAASDSAKLATKDKEIQALKSRSIKTRVIVQRVIDTIPDLRLFVDQQDSIILEQQEQVDTLKSALQFREKLFDDLVVSHNAERDISKRIEDEQGQYIQKLEKQVKKAKRGSRWLKAGIVGAVVGGLFLGVQL